MIKIAILSGTVVLISMKRLFRKWTAVAMGGQMIMSLDILPPEGNISGHAKF